MFLFIYVPSLDDNDKKHMDTPSNPPPIKYKKFIQHVQALGHIQIHLTGGPEPEVQSGEEWGLPECFRPEIEQDVAEETLPF